MLNVHPLRVLAEVARTGSYTAAARALGYTQPAVSYQMRSLERTVGVPLAVRVGRTVQLTAAGRKLAVHADSVLAALRSVESEFERLAAHSADVVRLSAIQSACVAVVPGAMAKLRREQPDIEVTLHQASCPESYRLLRSGEIDLALMCDLDVPDEGQQTVVPDAQMLRLPLLTDRRCILLPAGHPLADHPTLALEDLAGEQWVLETGRSRFLAKCAKAGFEPKVTATTDDQATIHNLVASGVGIAMMDGLGLAPQRDPQLAIRPLDGWPRRRVYALLWPDMIRVTAISTLLRALRAAVDERLTAIGINQWLTAATQGAYLDTRKPGMRATD
ncbi:LysR family transcriptional regulator [Streptomyces sp. NPDC052036]|uniref:LysR family transcriptional regulator n=1 Tax=unclassified Streptomyces TaxID=2593676 RepID=UPI00342F5B64